MMLYAQESFKYFDLRTYKWGIMNTAGQILIEPQYQSISSKYGFYCLQSENSLFELVDHKGKRVLQKQYYSIRIEAEDSIFLGDFQECGIMNSSMEWIYKSDCEWIYREYDFFVVREKKALKH